MIGPLSFSTVWTYDRCLVTPIKVILTFLRHKLYNMVNLLWANSDRLVSYTNNELTYLGVHRGSWPVAGSEQTPLASS